MKISQKQAELLAGEILKTLKKENVGEASPIVVARIEEFVEKRESLLKACKVADDAYERHTKSLNKICPGIKRLYDGDSMDEIVRKVKESKIPSLEEIQNKIILRAMFASSEDLEAFVQSIVKEYTKKASKQSASY